MGKVLHITVCALVLLSAAVGRAQNNPTLARLATRDAAARTRVMRTAGKDSSALWNMLHIDSINTDTLKILLTGRVWFCTDSISKADAKKAFTILQHSTDRALQEGAIPFIKKEADRGLIRKSEYAELVDRVLIFKDQPQLYGTQLHEINGSFVPYPITDSSSLSQRRSDAGLPDLEFYVKMTNTYYEKFKQGKK
jgi:hypothetical protein